MRPTRKPAFWISIYVDAEEKDATPDFPLDRNGAETLDRQLYNHMRHAIMAGTMAPGQKVYHTRAGRVAFDFTLDSRRCIQAAHLRGLS